MQAYQLQVTDGEGRPVIHRPFDLAELIQQPNRTVDVADGVRVYLEELTSGDEGHTFDEASHGFDFGSLARWGDVIQSVVHDTSVQEAESSSGNNNTAQGVFDARDYPPHRVAGPPSPQRASHHAAVVDQVLPAQPHQDTFQSRRQPSPSLGAAATVPQNMSRKDQWASYAPAAPADPSLARNYGVLKVVDVTPDPRERKFAPLPTAFHSCVAVPGLRGATHFIVFGGTNGRSDESELYEFTLVTASWRRLEGKGSLHPGSHSHSVVYIAPNRILHIGGVAADGGAPVETALIGEAPQSLKRLDFLCPKMISRTRSASTRRLLLEKSRHVEVGGGPNTTRGNVSLAALVPQLAAAQGLHLNDGKGNAKTQSRRRFVVSLFDFDLETTRWREVRTQVALPLAAHTASAFGSFVYVFGGVNERMEVSDKLIAVDPNSFAMRLLRRGGDVPCARYYHSSVVYGQWVIIYGGFDSNNEALSDAWAFDCVQETWEKMPLIGDAKPRAGHAACIVGCRMMLVGGFETSLEAQEGGLPSPVATIVEVNLVPTAKGHRVAEITPKPELPPLAFATAADCGDSASMFVYGGVTVKPKSKAVKKKKGHDDNDSDEYSEDEHHNDSSVNASKLSAHREEATSPTSAEPTFFASYPISNKSFLVTFPHKPKPQKHKESDGPKLNHLGLVVEEGEVSEEFKAFVQRQIDFVRKREGERNKTIKKLSLEEREGAEVSLHLTPEEIERLLLVTKTCCDHLSTYAMSTLPQQVPDKEVRIHHVEECISFMRQAKDVMHSMKGQEGPKQVKSKGHRKKSGQKFEDHSAAKPFRRVVIMDLIQQTNKHMQSLRLMNKSLKTVLWEQKDEYINFTHEIHEHLKNVVKVIKDILEKYINHRVESLMKAEEKHKETIASLRQIVEKIQHDKVFKKETPDLQREKRKNALARDKRANDEDDEYKRKHHGRSRSASPSSAQKKKSKKKPSRSSSPKPKQPPKDDFKEVIIELLKDEGKQLIKRAEWVQKAAHEFAQYCAKTVSYSTVPPVAPTGPTADPASAPHQQPSQPNPQSEAAIRDSDAAKCAAIALCNDIASQAFAFSSGIAASIQPPPETAGQAVVTAAIASENNAKAAAVGATVVDPKASPPVPNEKPVDPVKNFLFKLSVVRPLLKSQEALKVMMEKVGRMRHNTYDKNDAGGPKQDMEAENYCRTLLTRQTDFLARVTASFLSHKGARPARSKVVTEDPLALTSAQMKAKEKAKRDASAKAREAAKNADAAPAVTMHMHPHLQQHQQPIQPLGYSDPNQRTGEYVLIRPLAPLEQQFKFSDPQDHGEPTKANEGVAYVTTDIRGPSAGPAAAVVVPSFVAPQPPPAPSPYATYALSDNSSVVVPQQQTGVIPVASTTINGPSGIHPELLVPAPPPPPPALTASSGSGPGAIVGQSYPLPIGSNAPQAQIPQPPLPGQAPTQGTTLPPQQPTNTVPPLVPSLIPLPIASPSVIPTPMSTVVPSANSNLFAVAASVPSSGNPAPSTATAPALQLVQPSVPTTPVPQAPPSWITPAKIAAQELALPPPAVSTAAASSRPPLPVSVSQGPFNGGMGSFGTYAPIEDYFKVMRPTSEAFHVIPSKPENPAVVPPVAKPVQGSTVEMRVKKEELPFKGKLTYGEKMILKAREGNKH